MDYIMSKGCPLDGIAGGLFDTIDEKDEKRAIINKITGNMLDRYEALTPVVDALEVEMADADARKQGFDASMAGEHRDAARLEKKLADLEKKIAKPPPEEEKKP